MEKSNATLAVAILILLSCRLVICIGKVASGVRHCNSKVASASRLRARSPGELGFCGTNLLAFSVGVRPKSLWRVDVGSQKWWLGLFFCLVFVVSVQAQQTAPADEATRRMAVDIFKQLIEINTTDSVGSVTAAAEARAQRVRDAG